ncbi:DUF402 domain-containing protein [candidate division WOR-3 bacterium]|nr:DUF402 domain-containing protein [candidate division WOR-3 bacterium]
MKSIIERKIKLSGETEDFQCEIIEIFPDKAILKYTIEKETSVAGLVLSPGDVTRAYYSEKEPYVLYRWFSKKSVFMGDYFNIADSVKISGDCVRWRDLEIDLLFLQNGTHLVLDEDKLPENISLELKKYIDNAVDFIVRNYESIVGEFDGIRLFRP